MKYFILKSRIHNDPLIPGMNGRFVKNKDAFFRTGEMGPNKFYDRDYEFDYLVPQAYGDPEPEAEIIADYHSWHGMGTPRGGITRVVSAKLKELLEEFTLSASKFYKARVLFKEEFYPYYVWHILMDEYEQYIDFNLTKFNNLDSWGKLTKSALEMKQFASMEEMEAHSEKHWGWEWNFERLVLKPGFKELDFCMFPLLNFVASERLKKAIEDAGIFGIEFLELPLNIELSDDVQQSPGRARISLATG